MEMFRRVSPWASSASSSSLRNARRSTGLPSVARVAERPGVPSVTGVGDLSGVRNPAVLAFAEGALAGADPAADTTVCGVIDEVGADWARVTCAFAVATVEEGSQV